MLVWVESKSFKISLEMIKDKMVRRVEGYGFSWTKIGEKGHALLLEMLEARSARKGYKIFKKI